MLSDESGTRHGEARGYVGKAGAGIEEEDGKRKTSMYKIHIQKCWS